MGKKRKAIRVAEPDGPREYDPKDARLGPINTYEDLADDAERHFLEQDEILFNDAPKSKRQKQEEEDEEFLEDSDEEILPYDEGSDEDDARNVAAARKSSKLAKSNDDDASEDGGGEEEGDDGFWGSSRKDYYDADQIETAVDAEEEEKEARRLQKKKLAKMSEDDFFNEQEWLAPETEDGDQNDVVTEVLKDIEIPADMSPEERYRLLRTRYPELPFLADELLQLQPLLGTLQKQADGQLPKSLVVAKFRILGCYVATLAMYFATLTSPARDSGATARALDPAELRDHEVMGTLLECRETWKKVEHLEFSAHVPAGNLPSPPEDEPVGEEIDGGTPHTSEMLAKPSKRTKPTKKAKELEKSLADLDSLLLTKKPKKKTVLTEEVRDGNSDFGEEETLDARTAAEKAARKKSLRFYTSQIVQKANRRAEAGNLVGGDTDIPYRERLRDRQARLNAEAEKRGKRGPKPGANLGQVSDDDDDAEAAKAIRDNEDDYYNMVAGKKKDSKESKADRAAAIAAAGKADRVVEVAVVENGKRKISYQIEKNKGLAPKRSKENRNPRVKKRKQYDTKVKKLKSQKAIYKGGEAKGGYAGEKTGIKPGLIKSIKL